MRNLKYQHRTAEIMRHYTRGISMTRISALLNIPCTCVCRVIRQHVSNAAGRPKVIAPKPLATKNVLDLERKDGAVIHRHPLIERALWSGLEHWRGLH